MITVSLKPVHRRHADFMPDEPPYLLSGIVNWRLTVRPHAWRPPTDIYETEDSFVVRVEVAGMNNSEFAVTVDSNTLVIRGVRQDTPERRAFQQMEIHFGEFIIEVEFSGEVDINNVAAEYHDGFLTVTLPKLPPKQIVPGEKNP